MTTGREVLGGGGADRPPRVPVRVQRGVALGLVVLVAAVAGGRELRDRQQEQRAREAAFAVADAVHLAGRLSSLTATGLGSGRVSAEVQVLADGDARGNVLRSVRLEGDGLGGAPPLPGVPVALLPTRLHPEAPVDCAAVGAGAYPTSAAVVLTVLPDSGVEHEVRVEADPGVLREAALTACDLPDPDRRTAVEASGRDGQLLVVLDPVPRSPDRLVLRGVRVPGLEVGAPVGLALPHVLPPGTGAVYALPLRVHDCARARAGGDVVVLLEESGRDVERVAGPAVTQPQPGQVPVAEAVRALVEERCP